MKAGFEKDIVSENERIRWSKNDKIPSRLELRDYFHAFESEENRSEMIRWVMSMFQLLHIIDIFTPQINQARIARLRPEGVATFGDVMLRPEELPVACQELLRHPLEKVNKAAATIREPQKFTQKGLNDRPADLTEGPPEEDDDEGNSWDDVGVNEHEGPSVGKAKASHAGPKPEPAPKPAPATAAPQAAVTGAPSPENVEEGTFRPVHHRVQVECYKYKLDENINGEVVEHAVVDSHPYERLTKICWEMDGADRLKWPGRLTDHRTKVNAVTRGQPGRNTPKFDEEMWLDLEDFFEEYNKMLPRRIHTPTVKNSLHCSTKTTNVDSSSNALLVCSWQPVKGWPFGPSRSEQSKDTARRLSRRQQPQTLSMRHLFMQEVVQWLCQRFP